MSDELYKIFQERGLPPLFPAALVGGVARRLRVGTEIPLRRVKSSDELNELIAQYSAIERLPYPVLIEDFSYVPVTFIYRMLKFVEESKLDIVLMSTYDVFTNTMLSRLRTFIKTPIFETESLFLLPVEGRERVILSEDTHELDKIRHQGQISPMLYMMDKEVPIRPNRQKVLNLLD